MHNEKAYAIYLQAEKNLEENPSSEMDDFIVNLWLASKNLYTKNQTLTEQLSVAESTIRRQNGSIDLLETRLAGRQGGSSLMMEKLLKTPVIDLEDEEGGE